MAQNIDNKQDESNKEDLFDVESQTEIKAKEVIPEWKYMTKAQKTKHVIANILRPIGLLACLYFFICSLDVMSSSFRLIAGPYTNEIFESPALSNPLAGLMIGVLVTVILQSSSTSTSIIVSLVASNLMTVEYAIPVIMGANVGTSITSALVSLGQVSDKEKFRKAFSGATVHDMFNVLSVIVLLLLEIILKGTVGVGYLNFVTSELVDKLVTFNSSGIKQPELLHAITKPFTNLIIQLDKDAIDAYTVQRPNHTVEFRKHICYEEVENNTLKVKVPHPCHYLFESVKWPEWVIGLLLLIISLVTLITCLILLVKLLNSLFKTSVAKILQNVVNADFPGPFKYLTGYVAIGIGCALTILVQSSSVFMSSITPLVGLGLVEIERVFPLALGSNIGTTITGILAAFSASPSRLKPSLQIALCHTLFNITGILIWYPLSFMRKVPIKLAKLLGKTASEYRWFVVVYICSLYFLIPLSIFGLSMAGVIVLGCVLSPIAFIIIFAVIVNVIQDKKPTILPKFLRTWNFLPEFLHSLDPYDRFISKYLSCCRCCSKISRVSPEPENNEQEKEDEKMEMTVFVVPDDSEATKKIAEYNNEAFTNS